MSRATEAMARANVGRIRLDLADRNRARAKHGMRHTPTYHAWSAMRQRVLSPTHPAYANYGGRGITVCDRWSVFANFFADMGEKPDGLTLDRINNEGNYEPGNCRWATYFEQIHNRRPRRQGAAK